MSKLAWVKNGTVISVTGREAIDTNQGSWIDATGVTGVKPGWTWDGAVFAAPAEVVYRKIRTEAFWERFTNAELVDYDVAMQHNPADNANAKKAAAKLRLFKADADQAGYRKLDANKVIDFVNTLAILGAGRAATILNTPITADEAYIA